MQFNREQAADANAILACAEGVVRLREREFRHSLIVTRTAIHDGWRPSPVERLAIADFGWLIEQSPDVLLLGTGARQQIPPPELYAALAARRIGLEAMDNRAACRTFNLLLSESREVALALIL